MKYVVLSLETRYGEYSFLSTGAYEIPDDRDIVEWGSYMASMEYAEDTDELSMAPGEKAGPAFRDDTYFFNGGEIAVRLHSVQEVSKKHYKILKQYI